MKIIKKIGNIFLISVLLSVTFFTLPMKGEAKTLRQLKEEYQKTLDQYNANKNKEKLTQEQINTINNNVALIQANIEKGQKDIIALTAEIAAIQEKMVEKDKEIKKILNFLQISEGENAYLEYAFGANTFTDFIYRMAVTEQLSSYNDKLIKEYNSLIEQNKKKQEEIAAKEVQMKQQQADLIVQLSKLESQMGEIYEDYVDLSASLEVQDAIIKMYENDYKCSLDQDLTVCANKALPSDTAFWRPTSYGYMSSNYGMRWHPIITSYGYMSSNYGMRWHPTQKKYKLHTGVDIAVSTDTPVYAVAAGTVVGLTIKYYCGGNMIFIIHRVNGQYYTSVYMHLHIINVSVG
ncbi:MAG TPA: peptidoglycan DD-metalloendopeptidase family protein, partial [Bacilli bacterium]|nr:peptidoglycan DD-metalloendopeptidase family protein [Bacilli bacterium]